MKNIGTPYTQEDIDFICENYVQFGAEYCAKKLQRSKQSIFNKANRLGLKSNSQLKSHKQYELDLLELESGSYPLEEYKGAQEPILHTCILGHKWKARPNLILQGHGCPECNGHGSFKYQNPAIFYYIRVTKANETYYKVGVTNSNIRDRFKKDRDKNFTLLYSESYSTGREAKDVELEILRFYSSERQNIKGFLASGGNSELFEYDVLGLDSNPLRN